MPPKPTPKPNKQPRKWAPNPGPQTKFLASTADEVLYGGAAGGGKSAGLIAIPLRWISHPRFFALILRRTLPQLRDLLKKAELLYPTAEGEFNITTKTWTFPSGAQIAFGHCEHENDWKQYSGFEIQYLGIDELTSFTRTQWVEISARLRSSAPGLPRIARASSNPGDNGHEWVFAYWGPWLDPKATVIGIESPRDEKGELFRPPASPGQVLWVVSDGENETFYAEPTYGATTRQFIPARLADNPKLLVEDPEYVRKLYKLDPVRRAQLEKGDWLKRIARGDLFKREWFKSLPAMPKVRVRWVRYWDRGATLDGDWTVGCKVGLLPDRTFVVAHVDRFRGTPGTVKARIRSIAETDGKGVTQVLEQDPGQAGVAERDDLVKHLAGFNVRSVKPTGDKVTRAGPASAQVEAGNVFILYDEDRPPSWLSDFFGELESFPEGARDDQVDAFDGAVSYLSGKGTVKVSTEDFGEEHRSMEGWL